MLFHDIKSGFIHMWVRGMHFVYPLISVCCYLFITAVSTPQLWTDIDTPQLRIVEKPLSGATPKPFDQPVIPSLHSTEFNRSLFLNDLR
jgi:hypothetical protein